MAPVTAVASFPWDLALTKLSQRLPDLGEQLDVLSLRAQQVRKQSRVIS